MSSTAGFMWDRGDSGVKAQLPKSRSCNGDEDDANAVTAWFDPDSESVLREIPEQFRNILAVGEKKPSLALISSARN